MPPESSPPLAHEARRAILAALLFATQAFATGCGPAPFVPPDGKWNVLVLVPDTIRADHLSINGYDAPTSPAMDTLGREGANFSQAITAAPRTWQSFTTILTGLYPPHHGVRYIHDRPLRPGVPSLASLLGEQGYETAVFDPIGFLPAVTQRSHFQRHFAAAREAGRTADEALMEKVADFVQQEREKPFFAFVRLNGAHWPYKNDVWIGEFEPCEGHPHAFNLGAIAVKGAGAGRGVEISNEAAFRKLIWTDDPDEETKRHRIAHYDAEVRAVDELIGRLIDDMRGSGLLDRTIVLVTSDHGESFFEHGYQQHGPRVDDPVMRVPLVVRLPRGHPDFAPGRQIDGLVRTVDVAPTLLEAVGVAAPDGLDGVNLLPAIRGGELPPLWAYAESGRSFMGMDPERHLPGVAGKRRMVRTADWKLVYVPDRGAGDFRLFDLRADPGEQQNVASRHPERVAELRSLLDPILAAEQPRLPDRELGEEEIERLRELGYMQ